MIENKNMTAMMDENTVAMLLVIQEIMDSGQLWITIKGEEFYIPELIIDLQHQVQNND